MASEEYKAKLKEMFEPCMSRPDLAGKIEIVSLEWLLEMANPDPSDDCDLGADKPGIVSWSDLAKDLKKRGLREPLVIAVGLATGRARLEAGNHRVRLFLEQGFLHAPAVCWVGATHIGFEGNGRHDGRLVKFWPQAKPLVALGPYDERYFERPSDLLPSVPVWFPEQGRSAARVARASLSKGPVLPERKTRASKNDPALAKASATSAGQEPLTPLGDSEAR
jgi:hypothetical protein